MKLHWEKAALADMRRLRAWIAQDNPIAAVRVMQRMRNSLRTLEVLPLAGVPLGEGRLRRWIDPTYRYVFIYEPRIEAGEVRILAVFHPRQYRP